MATFEIRVKILTPPFHLSAPSFLIRSDISATGRDFQLILRRISWKSAIFLFPVYLCVTHFNSHV